MWRSAKALEHAGCVRHWSVNADLLEDHRVVPECHQSSSLLSSAVPLPRFVTPLCGDDKLSGETSLLSLLPSKRGGRDCLGVLINTVAHKGVLYWLTLIVVLPPPSPAVPSPG